MHQRGKPYSDPLLIMTVILSPSRADEVHFLRGYEVCTEHGDSGSDLIYLCRSLLITVRAWRCSLSTPVQDIPRASLAHKHNCHDTDADQVLWLPESSKLASNLGVQRIDLPIGAPSRYSCRCRTSTTRPSFVLQALLRTWRLGAARRSQKLRVEWQHGMSLLQSLRDNDCFRWDG
jgi:hypothetical protein